MSVKRPEDYRWSSLGHKVQTGNKDELLSLDFGLRDWEEDDPQEIIRKYREFVYETGAVDAGPVKCREAALPEAGFNRAGKGARIEQKLVDRERKKSTKGQTHNCHYVDFVIEYSKLKTRRLLCPDCRASSGRTAPLSIT